MKKKLLLIGIMATFALFSVANILTGSCAGPAGGGGGIFGFGHIGSIQIYLMDGGSFNYDDFENPITGGTEITDATITVTYEILETSISDDLIYIPESGGAMGYYTLQPIRLI